MRSFPTVALIALLCGAPAQALAQDDDAEVTRMAKEHYKAGLDAYKAGKYDVAIKELKKAYLLKRLPALLLNIGATYRKMGDLDLALHFYKKYLDEAPPEAKDRGEVESTIKEIQTEKEGGGAKPPEEAAPPKQEEAPPKPSKEEAAPPAKEWSHTVVDAAPPDSPLDVRVSTPVMKGVKVYLFYRGAGEESFNSVLMKRRGAEKVGRIPAKAMQGKAIQYYIEARDPAGTVVKSSGSQASPNVVMIDPSAPAQLVASSEERREREEGGAVEQPSAEEQQRRRSAGEEEEAPIMGQVKEQKRREAKRSSGGGGGGKMGPLMIAGIALAAGGAAALGVGIAGLVIANQKANSLTSDAMHDAGAPGPIDQNGNKIFFNNDPNATGSQEADLQSQGKMWNTIGIAMSVVGGVMAVAGIACIVADKVSVGSSDKPKKRKRRRADDEEASIHNLFVAPSAGPRFAGVGAGFTF